VRQNFDSEQLGYIRGFILVEVRPNRNEPGITRSGTGVTAAQPRSESAKLSSVIDVHDTTSRRLVLRTLQARRAAMQTGEPTCSSDSLVKLATQAARIPDTGC